MNQIILTPQPQAGQSPALGTNAIVAVTSNWSPFLQPGDQVSISVQAPSAAGHSVSVGIQLPGDTAKYAGVLDANGNLTFATTYGGPGIAALTGLPGLLLATGFFATGPGLMGTYWCTFLPAVAPAPAPIPGDATFEAAIENSWQTHVPVVDPYAPASWASVSYQSTPPYSVTPVSVPLFTGPWGGIALASAPANAMAALLGGSVQMQPPTESDYGIFYEDPYAVLGSLPSVPYIVAQMPIGANGALVRAIANAGRLANATLYRSAPGGIHAAILACFTEA